MNQRVLYKKEKRHAHVPSIPSTTNVVSSKTDRKNMRLIQLNFRRSFFVVVVFLINLYFLGRNFHWKSHWWYGNDTSCNFSMSESHGLFCESDEKWLERKSFYAEQREKNIFTMNEYENYFKQNWFPEFQCQNEIRLGERDGGKWVIDFSHH